MSGPFQRTNRPLERGDQLEVEIVALGNGPDGVAKVDGYTLFVPGTLPGERVFVEVTSSTRKFARGEVIELQTPAADRVVPSCEHFLVCGGCHRQHQYYPAQLEDKRAALYRTLRYALGEAALQPDATLAATPSLGQRHKVALHLRNRVLAQQQHGHLDGCLHRIRSADLIAVHECPTSDPLAWDLAQTTLELLQELPHRAWDPDFAQDGLLRTILVRTTTTGAAHVVLVARQAMVPGLERLLSRLLDAGATTVGVNYNTGEFSQLLGPRTTILAGPPRIAERIGNCEYLLSPDSFFQTSPQAAGQLIEQVLHCLAPTPRDTVYDLYCGVGLLTLPLAARAGRTIGMEQRASAIADARLSAERNRLAAQFLVGDVAETLAQCGSAKLPRPTVLCVDPPRTGLLPAVVQQIVRLAPARLAYVSCDLHSLGQDLKQLAQAGYRATSAVALDMFPHTCHVESVVGLTAAR